MHLRALCVLIGAALVPVAVADAHDAEPAAGSSRLETEYSAAIVSAVTGHWRRPAPVQSGHVCTLEITQLPGGFVISARAGDDCPYDAAGKQSLEAAALNAQPLPYRGYESVFRRRISLAITVSEP